MFGKDGKKKELIKNLNSIYELIQREHHISPGDFPDVKKMQVGVVNIWCTRNFTINIKLNKFPISYQLRKIYQRVLFIYCISLVFDYLSFPGSPAVSRFHKIPVDKTTFVRSGR